MNTYTENTREIKTSKGAIVKITTWWIFHTEGEFVREERTEADALRFIIATDASARGAH